MSMESLLISFPNKGVIMYALLLFIVSLFLWVYTYASRPKNAPPHAAGAWPIIGHLHLLGGSQLPHITLGSLADKYGPIFTINLGIHKTLVVSDRKTAEECLGTNDKAFANRPKFIVVEVIGYNYAMFGLGPYGSYWRQMRQMAIHELLSNKQLRKFAYIRESEVKESIKDVYHLWLKNKGENGCNNSGMVKVEMKQWFGRLTLNMVVRMLVGKRYSSNEEGGEGGRSLKAIRKFLELLGTFVVGDAIPFLRWLDLGGYEKAMKKNASEIDDILQGWLEEHKGKRGRSHGKGDGEDEDFMAILLSSVSEGSNTKDLGGHHPEAVIKATCLALLAGATDTTMVTMTWALCLLLNNRHELQKAQKELDIHVGRDRQVEESDLKNLTYLQAIIKESLRLYPAGQLLAPHESLEDCTVSGYTIPKGTRLVLNLSKIHRDPNMWSDPCEFQPERFLTRHKDVDVKGNNFELLPFGSGRRMCPGSSLGLQIMQLTLANLIHGFEFETLGNETIDMSESIGLSNLKASPLEVLIAPRLSSYA